MRCPPDVCPACGPANSARPPNPAAALRCAGPHARTPRPRAPRQEPITPARESGQLLLRQRPSKPPGTAYAALPALTGAPKISPTSGPPYSAPGLAAWPLNPTRPHARQATARRFTLPGPEVGTPRPRAPWTVTQSRLGRPTLSASPRFGGWRPPRKLVNLTSGGHLLVPAVLPASSPCPTRGRNRPTHRAMTGGSKSCAALGREPAIGQFWHGRPSASREGDGS
jgi:hypothetical protein